MRIRSSVVLGFLGLASSVIAAVTPDTVTIPLQAFQVPSFKDGAFGGSPITKLAIPISLGGGAAKLYEFDTGASGLYAAYAATPDSGVTQWWPSFTPVSSGAFTQTYDSGLEYQGQIVSTSLSLGHGVPAVTVNVGQILTSNISSWDIDDGAPPIFGQFYGDFGCALGTGNGIFAVLPQLPGNLSSGFIVSTGGAMIPANSTNAMPRRPLLTVGLTANLRAQFPFVSPMQSPTPAPTPTPGPTATPTPSPTPLPGVLFPGSNLPVYQGELINGALRVTDASGASVSFLTGLTLDTGAPSCTIHDLNDGFQLVAFTDPATLTLVAPGIPGQAPLIMAFPIGETGSLTQVDITDKALPSHSVGYANSGLNLFMRNDVMFDVERGVVRFRPILSGPPRVWANGSRLRRTGASSILLRGSAEARAQLLDRVEVRRSPRAKLTVHGLLDWKVSVPLRRGKNEFVVRAIDLAGTSSVTRRITIIRR